MEDKNLNCSRLQRKALAERMIGEHKLIKEKYSNSFTEVQAQEKWEDIAVYINTYPGPKKDWRNWKKTWYALRAKAKARKVSIAKHGNLDRPTTSQSTLGDMPITVRDTCDSSGDVENSHVAIPESAEMSQLKLSIRESYYRTKLLYMERRLLLMERQTIALEQIANKLS